MEVRVVGGGIYLSSPDQEDTASPANILVVPELLDGDDIDGVRSVEGTVTGDGDEDVFFHVERTRVEEPRFGNDLFHDFADGHTEQLDNQRRDLHGVSSVPEELVDETHKTSEDDGERPHTESIDWKCWIIGAGSSLLTMKT